MARIVFDVEINAPAKEIIEALDSTTGIAGWWTEDVSYVDDLMTVGFPGRAPVPFELRVDEVRTDSVRWSSVGTFPPHWAGTDVTWTLTSGEGAATAVRFVHDNWASDEGHFGGSALTWGWLMYSLKAYVETGTGTPIYTAVA